VTLAVRFYAVDGENMNADGGFIEVADDTSVTISSDLAFAMGLPAWLEPRNPKSPSTRPVGGFERIGEDGGRAVYRPVGVWDAAQWIDKVRYHFRTPYLRPGEVERS
jgi:hypothetical protein